MNDFFIGAGFWWRGWAHLIAHPRLLLLALFPSIITILLTMVFIALVFVQLPDWVQALSTWLIGSETSWWADVLYYSVVLFGGLLIMVGFLYVGYLLHRVIAAPFYSVLAEKVLRSKGVPVHSNLANVLRMLWVSLGQTFVFVVLGIMLFLVSLFPALNILAFAVTLLLVAFDLCSFAFESMGYGLRQRLDFLNQNKQVWAGMGLGIAITLLVPGLTLLVLPGAVTGAALIIAQRFRY